ncbi:MAG: cardiolipin synthase [Prevotellaceae bacterium]|jgi:cardiolipin synthase|nr:cardiolipin synthase [Prevotellaceae bacterium]
MWDYINQNLVEIVLSVNYLTAIAVSIIMIHNHTKRDPLRTMMWTIVLFLLPVGGIVLYVFFGQNYRKTKIFNKKLFKDLKYIERLARKQVSLLQKKTIFDNYPQHTGFKNIMTLLLNNSKALISEYNSITTYHTGAQTFDAIKAALLSAKNHIHIEFYIIEDDVLGNEIKDILVQKATEGVDVRVIYDDVGSWSLPRRYTRAIKRAGGKIFPFMKVRFPFLSSKLNYRNHRKILVVDGKLAFMGGVNIADRYIDGGKFGYWADTHLKIEGEATRSLQTIFMVDWYFVSGEILIRRHQKYFPDLPPTGKTLVQVVASGPDSDWAGIMQAYFTIINSAEKHIYLSTPYFMPNESILTAIKTASLSGVDVRLMLPERNDSRLVYWSTLSFLSELMDAGVKVYLYTKGFNHSKFITADSRISAVGSANIDMRSFEHNFEVTTIIYNEDFTRQLERSFHIDTQNNSKPVNPERWHNRPIHKTIIEGSARLLTPLL